MNEINKKNIDSWMYPLCVNGEVTLSIYSARVDLITSILNLDEEQDSVLLDMHYSLLRSFVWRVRDLNFNLNKIIKNLENNKLLIIDEVNKRLGEFDGRIVYDHWYLDMLNLMKYLSKLPSESMVSFKRE